MEKVKITGNEPAYPTIEQDSGNTNFWNTVAGLTKREQFAMAAMQGLGNEFQVSESHNLEICARVACRAVRMADALIEELNKD